MSVLRVGKDRDDQICQAFRELIRAVNECKKVSRSYWALLPIAQLIAFVSVALLGAWYEPKLSPIKVTLSDSVAAILALVVILSLVTLAIVTRRHNLLVSPIHKVLKAAPEINKATRITHENHAGAKVSIIKTDSDEFICSMAFNPVDSELVRLAYKTAGKKPPMIFNNLGI